MHWVAAQSTATAAALFRATGESPYDDWYRTWWGHIDEVFLDHKLGSWRHELDLSNRLSGVTWNGKPEFYHAFQATLSPRLPRTLTLATDLRDGLLDKCGWEPAELDGHQWVTQSRYRRFRASSFSSFLDPLTGDVRGAYV